MKSNVCKAYGFECCNTEECGIIYSDGYNGVNDKGYWIVALFKEVY